MAHLAKTYLEDEEGAKLLLLADRLKNDVCALFAQIKNYVEEKTVVELGKEVTDSSDSDYESPDTIILPKATISKKKRKYPGKRKNVS
jgi:uncharacterized protein YeeX (DUF496 family)